MSDMLPASVIWAWLETLGSLSRFARGFQNLTQRRKGAKRKLDSRVRGNDETGWTAGEF